MRVSFNQAESPRVKDTNGYGYAAKLCKESLVSLGHEVTWRDSTADIEMNFIQPDHWHWTGPYRIGYVPWESTEFLPGWIDKMNNDCDELWTPSPVIAQWMRDAGATKDVKIYQHGVEAAWTPYLRQVNPSPYRILHHGAEALRKGGREAVFGFLNSLGDQDAHITMKMLLENFAITETPRLKVCSGKVPLNHLVRLYHSSHLFLYPSWGEGFGLTPLQAMATGMPVLITRGWAPYEYLLPDDMLIDSTLVDSPWPVIHPGKMFKPDMDDLQDKLKSLYDNHVKWNEFSSRLAYRVHDDYNWLRHTYDAFEPFM